ncbi:hypothetical protein ACHRV1_21760 [Flavobacterium aquidurense]|uniref:hypothetical protein n=1 Tax=Flavobacterium aquidurense TaxID=362413 RepID=UPI0037566DB8
MLKTILNFSGVEVISKIQQKNILGGEVVARCERFAPSDVNPIHYPDYPCDTPPLAPVIDPPYFGIE